MRTEKDLLALAPILIDLMQADPQVGDSYHCLDEDGWNFINESAENDVCYDKDDWNIEIIFNCHRNGRYYSGDIEQISVYYYDDDLESEVEFSPAETSELYDILNNALRRF